MLSVHISTTGSINWKHLQSPKVIKPAKATTEALIADIKEEDKKAAAAGAPGAGGMGGMY